jgi:membrane protease subunit HflC
MTAPGNEALSGEIEQMVITRFGTPVGAPVTSAGLKFEVPFITGR